MHYKLAEIIGVLHYCYSDNPHPNCPLKNIVEKYSCLEVAHLLQRLSDEKIDEIYKQALKCNCKNKSDQLPIQ